MKKFTNIDLLKMLKETSEGFGLYAHQVRTTSAWLHFADPYAVPKLIDDTAIKIAKKMGWDLADLADFYNSKPGRWAGDAMAGGDEKKIFAALKEYMTMFKKEWSR